MPWASTALSVGGSLLGGVFGGGSKKAERAAKDAAARAQFSQDQARRQAQQALMPYQELGQGAARKLSEYLGTADPVGYAPRPTLQDFEDQLRDEHFRKYGKDYRRDSNVAGQTVRAKQMYQEALKNWEQGKAKYQAENPDSMGDGRLLKDFTNEDFVKDPGYTFRQLEGEKGINRQQLARGGFDSGAALKELQRYTQDYASNEFNNAFTRDAANKQRTFSFLSGGTGTGLSAAGAQVGANQNAANNAANIQLGLGNTLGNISMNNADNQSNAFQQTISNLIYGLNRNKPTTSNSNAPIGSTVRDFSYGGTSQDKYYV